MARHWLGSILCTFVVSSAACGVNPIAPTSPSASSVSGLSIIASHTELPIGGTEQLSAKLTLDDGTTRPVPAGRWRSDAPGVATVDDGGHLRAVGVGRANISLEFGEARASVPVTVRVDFAGQWRGGYSIEDCAETGEFDDADVCDTYFPKTTYAPRELALALGQNGSEVSGRASFDRFGTDLAAAPVTQEGTLRTTSSFAYYDGRVTVQWALTHAAPDRIDGTFVMTWTHVSKSGSMTVTGSLHNVAAAPAGGSTPPPA